MYTFLIWKQLAAIVVTKDNYVLPFYFSSKLSSNRDDLQQITRCISIT